MFFLRAHLAPGRPEGDHPGSGQSRPRHPHPATPKTDADREFDAPTVTPSCVGGRLNLLLSHGGWNPEPWADTLPRLLAPMGVSSILARSARQAEEVIRRTTIHIAVVDLSIPLDDARRPDGTFEEAGPRVLELLSRLQQPPPTVVLKRHRSMRDQQAHMHAALRCGAFSVIDQTAANLDSMLQEMQRCLTRFYGDRWPSNPTPTPRSGDPGPNFA